MELQVGLIDATGLRRPAHVQRARPVGVWTPGLQRRLDGATFDDLAVEL